MVWRAGQNELERIEWPASVRLELSPTAAEFLRRHPDQAQRIVASALETAAANQSAAEPELDEEETAVVSSLAQQRTPVPPNLQPFIVRPETRSSESGFLNATQAAERLKLSRMTVYSWIKNHRLLAWSLTRQGVVIPPEQILGPGEVLPGLARVLELLSEPRSA